MSPPILRKPDNSRRAAARPRPITPSGAAGDVQAGGDGYPPFRARAPWWGADLQTVRNRLIRAFVGMPNWPAQRIVLPLADGSGDKLIASLNQPRSPTNLPLAILIHGLTGCETSTYMFGAAAALLAAGYPVLRLNLRGAGPSRTHCAGHYHAGRSEDLRHTIDALPSALRQNGVIAIGFSLGGNVLLKLLGETGKASPIAAAITVSAPIDLAMCAREMMRRRNAAYCGWLLTRLRRDAIAPGAVVSDAEHAAIAGARSLYAFDDRFVAPRHGFASADDYYARCAAQRYMADIAVPTMVIHARNDPWIPAVMYETGAWRANEWLTPLIAAGGGHVGFHSAGDTMPWHLRCALRFLRQVAPPAIAR